MKILSRSRFEEHVGHTLEFIRVSPPDSGGFSFPCDEQGKVDVEALVPAARDNYLACLAGTNGTKNVGVARHDSNQRVPAVGQCPCGAEVHLAAFTNTCSCGRDFNGSGEELASREQWGEETGESWQECY